MKRILAGWWLLLGMSGSLPGLSSSASAQSYNVALIPDSLLKSARVVVREEEFVLEIKSPEKAIEKKRVAYTILSENADDYAEYEAEYGKFTSLNSVSGTLYDASGKEIKRFKKKDMDDHSYITEDEL